MADLKTGQESMSSVRQSTVSNESSNEKTIYENLLEIFPLVEDFMKNQGSITRRAFSHQAPVSFTRAPSRQTPHKRKLEQKALVASAEDSADRSDSLKPVNVPLAQGLQRNIDELSKRLLETQLQSSSVTKELQSALELKETQIIEMELMVRRLQKEVQRREQVAYSAQRELAETQDELANMRSVVETAESNISQMSRKPAGFEQALLDVQLELSALHSQVEANDQALEESLQNVFNGTSSYAESVGQRHSQNYLTEWYRKNRENMELARRAYLAAVIVARESNEESTLALCASLRFQLQAFLRQSDFFVGSQ